MLRLGSRLFANTAFWIGGILILAIVFIVYDLRNPETDRMDDIARQNAPGKCIRLSHGVTHYEMAGADSAETIILVHGFSVPYYIWDGTFDTLVSRGYRVVRYDLYGRGYSDRPDVQYTASLYETQLLELIQALGIHTPVHLAGTSLGGPITSHFTARHPELVKGLILVDPVIAPLQETVVPEQVALYYTVVNSAERMAENQVMEDFYKPENFATWIDRYKEQMKYKGFLRALLSTRYHFHADPQEDFRTIAQHRKPVLLVWGRQDRTTPFAGSKDAIALLDAEFVPVDEAGHMPHIENPQAVHGRLIQFLERQAETPVIADAGPVYGGL